MRQAKRLILLTLCAILAACAAPPPSPTTQLSIPPTPQTRAVSEKITHGQGYKQIEEGITVVHLTGNDAEIRAQYAALLKDEIAAFQRVISKNRTLAGITGGCSNFAAFGPMTTDGKLWHARNFDFYGLGAMDRYKVIYVVEPEGKLPYVSISWAGWNGYAQVHTAMNAAGISLGYMWSNSNSERIGDAYLLWELYRDVLANTRNLDEAIAILRTRARRSAANLLLTDAKIPDAVVVEMTSQKLSVRQANGGAIFAANHFVAPEMREPIKDPNSDARYQRLGDLLNTNRGQIDLTRAVAFLRDRYDPLTRRESFTGDVIAWNMNVLAVVFSPSDLNFWVARGLAPAAYSGWVGFRVHPKTR